MPEIRVQDSKTGKVSRIQWNKPRAPRPDEIRAIVEREQGAKAPTGFNLSDEDWSVPPPPDPERATARVFVGQAPPEFQPSMFSKVVDTAYGGENSVLPPIRGVTRPALPELPRESWGPEQLRWKPQMIPGTNIPSVPAISDYAYNNLIRPSSSVVGAASDWATGKVLGPIFKGVGRWARGAEEVAEHIPTGAAPSYAPVQKALPQAAESARGHFIVNEAGVASHSARPYSPLERNPLFDPRSVRGPSGTVNPNTGRVVPARENGRFVARVPEPVPTVKASEMPIVDMPPEIAAAYDPKAIQSARISPPGTPDLGPGFQRARQEAANEINWWDQRAAVNSPTDAAVRGGPVVAEDIGRPLARRVGETREAFRARVAAESGAAKGAALETSAIPDVASPDLVQGSSQLGKSIGSGQSLGAASNRPGIFSRLGETLADQSGSVPRKRVDLRTAASRRRTMRELEQKAAEDAISPKDVKTVEKLSLPESWKQFLPERLRNEKGAIDISAMVNRMTGKEKARVAKEVGPDWVQKIENWYKSKPGDVPAPGAPAKEMKVGFGQSKGSIETPITREAPGFKTPGGQKRLTEEAMDAMNAPRSVMASLDLSGFRQAIGSMHKKELWKNVPEMFRAAGSEKVFKEGQAAIASHPKYVRASKAQLAVTDLPKPGGNIRKQEELFMSKFAEKIPGLGKLVRASGRGYVTLLNKTRMDLFNSLTEQAAKSGAKTSDKEIAQLVNAMTGRGNLPKTVERAAPILNSMFFSPRLMASRGHMLNPYNYGKASPMVRKEMLKSLAATGAAWGGLTGMINLIGGDDVKVEIDPRSTDFGKARIGNTRVDLSGGFQPYLRLASQLAPLMENRRGQFKDTETGRIRTFGEGYRARTEKDAALDFFEGKTAPMLSAILMHMEGKTITGEKPQWLPDMSKVTSAHGAGKKVEAGFEQVLSKSEITKKLTPMIMQDLFSLYKEDPKMMGWGAAGFFGAGINVQKRRTARRSHQ
jgi:hypothetical protein